MCYSLKNEYDKVYRDLESKLNLFKGAKERDDLQNKANTLANNINDKRKELQGKLDFSPICFIGSTPKLLVCSKLAAKNLFKSNVIFHRFLQKWRTSMTSMSVELTL